jgi:multiple antibiotic resistance protein
MTLYTITTTLLLVIDPLGNIPIFLSVLKRFDPQTQSRIILRESAIAFFILGIFVFFGHYILNGLHISTPALSIAGGIILFIIAIRLIFPDDRTVSKEDFDEPFIVPLAIPFTAGPSTMAMILLYGAREPNSQWTILLALFIACIISTTILLLSRPLMKMLGKRGLTAIEKLMGMVLTTLAVQMFLSGVFDYVKNPMF